MDATLRIALLPSRPDFQAIDLLHIGNANAHTWERGWGWLWALLVHEGIPIVFITIHGLMTHSLMFPSFVYRYTRTQPLLVKFILSSKIDRFLRKMDGPSRNLDKANFSPKKKGKQCAAFGCSNTFYGPNGLPTSFHFFKFMHGGMYFC